MSKTDFTLLVQKITSTSKYYLIIYKE